MLILFTHPDSSGFEPRRTNASGAAVVVSMFSRHMLRSVRWPIMANSNCASKGDEPLAFAPFGMALRALTTRFKMAAVNKV
jgi:hypothetical protein